MVASTEGKAQVKKVNSFSPKRVGIKRANTIIFGSMAASAVVVAICLVLVNFLWDLRSFNNRVTEARTETRETLRTNIDNLEPLKFNFFALEQDLVNSQVVLDALPSKYDFPALATTIDKRVEADGLNLRSFNGDDESANAVVSAIDPSPVEMPFNMVVEGSYEDLVTFVQNLEKTIRPMVIDAVDLSGTDDALRAEFRMHTFYQPAVDVEVETRTIE